ncbi:hypothetical protein ACUR5C_12765 [Aliikangiella sp. IMCC44653]
MHILQVTVTVISLLLATSLYSKNTIEPFDFSRYQLVGKSEFSVLFWDIYEINLSTLSGQYKPGDTPVVVNLTYKREIKASELIAETAKQWQRFKIEPNQQTQWLSRLESIWPNIREQDKLTFYIDNTKKTLFYHNERFIGEIDDSDFSDYFINIWVDPNGPYPKLTRELTSNLTQ